MNRRFVDKIALVTGAGGGIGRTTALAFAREGAKVVVAGRSPGGLKQTVELIEAEGGTATAVTADVRRSDEVAQAVQEAVSQYGGLDVAVNNAGIYGVASALADLDERAWDEVVQTNLTGTFLSLRHELAYMRTRKRGTIVNLASVVGPHITYPGVAAYAATKAGIRALTRVVAQEVIGDGIRVNSVSPGPTDTEMSKLPGETDAERDERMRTGGLPIGRVATTAEVAAAILWLASDDSTYAVGHDFVLDGGASA